ncbi:MAG TPA: cell division protein SepF [Oscillospiraceae bacterium]|nr:cell division protein SepF [Oscillospiraceae bacterium]
MRFIDNIKDFFGWSEEGAYDEDDEIYSKSAPVIDDASDKRNRVVNIHATAQLQVILVKPEIFADTKQIADHLNSKKTVVLNLESTTPDVTRRIIDFLGGVAYANGGNIKPVANNTFIITPYNVGFVGEDLVGELESNGVFI